MKSITKQIDGIGSILFEKSSKAKRLNISIRPSRGVRVALPRRVSFQQAEAFVYAKSSWIQKHLNRMKELELEHKELVKNSQSIDKPSAKKKLIGRLEMLAGKNGFCYNRVFIKNQKTRWGSKN